MSGSAAVATAAAIAAAVGLLGAGSTPDPATTVSPSQTVALTGSAAEAGLGAGDAVDEQRRWQWPVRPRPAVARPFVAPASAYGAGHRGLDLAASEGVDVLAVEAGVIVHAGVVAGRGTVSVEHADGLRSTYEPVTASVQVGDVVAAGDRLGTIEFAAVAPQVRTGAAHCGPASCLHLGARRGELYLDPLPLLAGGRVILLPLG